MDVRFKISEEQFFNNGRIILDSIPHIESSIRSALSCQETVDPQMRKRKGQSSPNGIDAKSLNVALRRCILNNTIKGETHVEHGVFFHDTKEGFDFSVYDEQHNMACLYNYYQGSIGILDGDKKILDINRKMGCSKKVWKGKIKKIQTQIQPNTDYIQPKTCLTVVGELQFGNWALIYRDLFRLLDAANNPGVDMYIYVAADDDLSSLLSANTVSFRSAQKVISDYLSLIKTPVWLIGLGLDII